MLIMDTIDLILRSKEFRSQKRDNHWLGNGVYFFIDDPLSAHIWPTLHKVNHGKKTCIIFCEVGVPRDRLLDLDTEADLKLFEDYLEGIKEHYRVEIIGATDARIRCFVMDTLPVKGQKNAIDAIKYTFVKNPRVNKDYSLSVEMNIQAHGPQLCVRNQECINKDSLKNYEYTC
ncbi:hypothetical protein ARX50_02220 [Listeria monocytogenes]|nr:hypothetical protein [Listeria monocytogenes]EAD3475326.1 hypothetical protein [Listeria monocytogenes]EAD5258970.1 hypothetical protein [Listeria monocytogenes]OFF49588.1 hypothetical protein BJM31_12540 [Listeria monocytogenes]